MINLISAIYDHAVEQMETIDETIQEYTDKIAALQRERDTLNQLYSVAVSYRKSLGSNAVSGTVDRNSVNNVPRPTTIRDPYVGRVGKDGSTAKHEGIVPSVEAVTIAKDKIVQSFSETYTLF